MRQILSNTKLQDWMERWMHTRIMKWWLLSILKWIQLFFFFISVQKSSETENKKRNWNAVPHSALLLTQHWAYSWTFAGGAVNCICIYSIYRQRRVSSDDVLGDGMLYVLFRGSMDVRMIVSGKSARCTEQYSSTLHMLFSSSSGCYFGS